MCFKLNNVLFGLIAHAINLVKVVKRCYKIKVLCALIYCYYEICNAFIDNVVFLKMKYLQNVQAVFKFIVR
jgi:hypothetical protein